VNRLNGIRQAVTLAALLLMVVPALAAPVSAVGDMDIGALMARAEETLDLDTTDVVLLFDGRDVSIAPDGSVETVFHQIVWISTELGIDEYADLRVPWNTTNTELGVTALRTWMDGRWWPHESNLSPTAIVETVPYAVASADDYTTMRETMLLHDGVELPCIMETVYTIARRHPDGVGSDGLWIFHRDDPAMLVRYSVTVAPEIPLSFAAGNGAPEPVVSGEGVAHRYTWTMENQPGLGVPHVADATAHAPYACWSTWRDWGALGSALAASLEGELTDGLRDTLLALTEHEMHAPARVEAVASFVAGTTRHIRYDTDHWAFEPRTVERIYETAYGHRLDRTALAAALLREVEGVTSVTPFFRSKSAAGMDTDVAGLSRFGDIELLVDGPRISGIYDPSTSSFTEDALDPFDGRTVWAVTDGAPRMLQTTGSRFEDPVFEGADTPSRFACAVTLEQDDDGAWMGTGLVEGSGALSPYRSLVGVGSETERFCDGVASDVTGGADITSSNTAVLTRGRSVVGFRFDWDPGEVDKQDRTTLAFGFCGSGLESRLPGDVHLYNQSRTSPVHLVAPLTETLRLRVELPEDAVAVAPAEVDVENGVGRFTQTVERDGDWLIVTRSLSILQTTVHPERWPELRALLLAGESAQAGTVLFR